MAAKPNIGTTIREQRKKIPLSLSQLSRLSGISVTYLGRIEQGLRKPSPRALQKIAQPLGFDLDELLVIAGFLSSKHELFSEEERDKLRVELNTLSERVVSDIQRITEILNRLLMS
jgi:transcriptional regulator with XRE-family HTH domain